MRKREPLVSVCIPTHNRGDLLKESIESVLSQTLADFELIVSDNASEDHTSEVVSSCTDDRIRYIRNRRNIGLINNFNQCLAQAQGRYVTVFHDDDLMLPDNLLLKVQTLDRNPGVGLVHSKFHLIDAGGAIIQRGVNFGEPETSDRYEPGQVFLRRSLIGSNQVNPSAVLMRAECYTKLGGFSDRILYTTDFEYWMRISLHYDIMFLATPLIKYRMHAGWASQQYLTIADGSTVPNLRAREEEYVAKRMILKRSAKTLPGWSETRTIVRRDISEQIAELVERELEGGRYRNARRSIIRTCTAFPELLSEAATAKMLVKGILGLRTVRALKRVAPFLGHRE
jgi:glycosyltransferase involved in cell wall biosynthesis